jgi:magnesium transporter
MLELMKKRSKKSGLPPGSLIHIGEQRPGKPRITVMDYDEKEIRERELERIEECFVFRDSPATTWIDVQGVHDAEILRHLGECYGFHPLVLEDVLNTDQRPKIEDYGDYLYIVLKMLSSGGPDGGIASEQISLILGPNFLFSFQEGIRGDVFASVKERIRKNGTKLRKLGADYLTYSLMDAVVDNYFDVLEKAGESVEVLEERLVSDASNEALRDIHYLKREMIFLRKALWPLREVVNSMIRGDMRLITDTTRIYLRDVYDHTIHVIDTIETLRDMVSGMLDIYLSSISNRMNAVMKVLTIIATLFMPLTFIAGVYGMNFTNIPELHWRYGYLLFWVINILIAAAMLIFFRRKKWL